MPLIFPSNTLSAAVGGVANSCRFNRADSPDLQKTNASSGDRKTWTFSAWIKRSNLTGVTMNFFSGGTDGDNSNYTRIQFNTGDNIYIAHVDSSSTTTEKQTTAAFRDPAAWYHVLWVLDTTQGSAADREKLYVNGTEITSFSTNTTPAQDYETTMNEDVEMFVGNQLGTWEFMGCYFAEVCFIGGSALTPSSFGEFDEDSPTVFRPIDVSGLTFGTNGFYLDFEDSTNLGNDANGGTDFTATNLAAIDQCTDSPTNNFATLNALLPTFSSTFSEGNCKWTLGTDSQYYWSNSTFGLSQGKWYMEAKLTTAAAHNYIGISVDQPDDSTTFLAGGGGAGGANDLYEWGWKSSDGKIYNNTDGGTAYGNTYTTGDILGMYLDLDNNKLYFAKNGTIENSGTGISITDPASTPTGFYFPCVADGSSSASSVWEVNFGNPTFSISSGNSDPNGYGNFEYSPNDGGSASFDSSAKDFYALNTKNLAEYG